ncbi:hypothetical protein JTB14_005340 [Gonioctena quinquepunctata]|nr:hypothetical protein JTB14_005340 [Gonioctena quinquepunctata]
MKPTRAEKLNNWGNLEPSLWGSHPLHSSEYSYHLRIHEIIISIRQGSRAFVSPTESPTPGSTCTLQSQKT